MLGRGVRRRAHVTERDAAARRSWQCAIGGVAGPGAAAALLRLALLRPPRRTRRSACEYRRLGLLEHAFDQSRRRWRLDPRDAAPTRASSHLARLGLPRAQGWQTLRVRCTTRRTRPPRTTPGAPCWRHRAGSPTRDASSTAHVRSTPRRVRHDQFLLCRVRRRTTPTRPLPSAGRALGLDAGSTVTRNNLALSLTAAGDYAAAEHEFLARPDAMTGRYNAGVAYLAAGRFSEAGV